jgi:DNA-binding NarL/FixJ family response regulator
MSVVAPKAIRVLIADDHPILRDGLSRLLAAEGGFDVVGHAADGSEAVSLARTLDPDVVLLDLAMPRTTGLDALRELSASPEGPRVLILTVAIEDGQLVQALELGARGIILKAAATDLLFKAIRSVVAGQYWVGRDTVSDIVRHLREVSARARRGATPADRLSPRERQVIGGVASGESNRDIATRLGLSEDTIKHHMTNIFNKLGVSNRAELAAYATTRGLLAPPV